MSPVLPTDQIQLVKQTWMSLRDVDPALLGDVFYSRLFLEHPSLRSLFIMPLEAQYMKLLEMINVTVARLDRPAELTALLTQSGLRHRSYGVKPEHYPAVGTALIWTLRAGLGRSWTPAVEAAWTAFYTLIANIMLEAS